MPLTSPKQIGTLSFITKYFKPPDPIYPVITIVQLIKTQPHTTTGT
jgi:hypothetical protein